MHGKKERQQNMMQLCNLFFMIRHESHNRGTNCLRGFSVQANLKSSESEYGPVRWPIVVNFSCELSLDKTEASITSMQLLTHMLICTNSLMS